MTNDTGEIEHMVQSTEETFRATNRSRLSARLPPEVVRVATQTGTPVIIWDPERGRVLAISPDEAEERLAISSTPGHSAPPDHSSD